ncbi:hypothetical protein FQN53_005907 [Emmonsiellopsis sp. PD_33]|nr:hypothetical protein FQN53_005907 [Emmonsiellopsis sp. PD_33]
MSSPTARAIVTHAPPSSSPSGNPWKLEPITPKPLGKTDLRVRIVASGICHTDLHIAELGAYFGGYPRVMGHEGAGYVEAIGDAVTVAQPGDPVLLSFAYCGTCRLCTTGHPAHCTRFSELNFAGAPAFISASTATATATSTTDELSVIGSFFGQSSFASVTVVAEECVVNVKEFVKSGEEEELRLFAPLGCGVQTGCASVTNVARATAGDTVVVMGLGGVGLSSVMAARITGCGVVVGIDRVEGRLGLARELGATHVINTAVFEDLEGVTEKVLALTEGLGATVVIDTTGYGPLMEAGVNFTSPLGRYVQIGAPPALDAALTLPVSPLLVTGKTIVGTIEGDAVAREYVPRMLGWYREGKLPLEKIVKTFRPEEFQEALKEMASGEAVKPVIVR